MIGYRAIRKPGWNARCEGKFRLVNQHEVRDATGLKCDACFKPVGAPGCCNNCFAIDFPGVTGLGGTCASVITDAGAQTIAIQHGPGILGTPIGALGCFYGTQPIYTGDWSEFSHGAAFDYDGNPYWSYTSLHFWDPDYNVAVLSIIFGTSTFYFGPPRGYSFIQKVYKSTNFSCQGGDFAGVPYAPTPGEPLSGYPPGAFGCATGFGTWPGSLRVDPGPCYFPSSSSGGP